MAIVKHFDKEYSCTTAIKGNDYVHLLNENGKMIVAFDGVSDFSSFSITGGSWATPTPENNCRIAVVKDDGTIGKGGHRCCDLEKTFYSVTDIGCTTASTMTEVWNALPSRSVLMMETKNFTDASWNTNELEYGFLLMRKPIANSSARGEIRYIGKSGTTYWMGLNNANAPNGMWVKVVTTNGDSTINGTLKANKIIGAVYA